MRTLLFAVSVGLIAVYAWDSLIPDVLAGAPSNVQTNPVLSPVGNFVLNHPVIPSVGGSIFSPIAGAGLLAYLALTGA